MATHQLAPKLHVLFFPYMAHGHTIPILDIAKLFASRNLKTTIVTTPLNQPLVSRQIKSQTEIDVQLLQFPTAEAGLPEGCEHLDFILSRKLGWDVYDRFSFATTLLQHPLEKLLQELRPDLVVADQFFPWATDSAAKFGIPRIVFHGNGLFAMCAAISVEQNIYGKRPNVTSDPTPFVIPDLPDEITITGKQLPAYPFPSETVKLFWGCREAELRSFGVIVNSFYELEPAYADHCRNFLGRKAWIIGPVSLCNRTVVEKSRRGIEASIDEHECLKWLNSKKKPNSVVYLSFGSISEFSAAQLKEIAMGLESSGKDFIWSVIRQTGENDDEDWLPEGFEERTKGKGLIIRGWAPQVVILEHEAVGGFVSHCGWNSTLEAIAAGKPMVTWPIGGEQFYNEKLLTEVLKIGVSVGVEQWTQIGGASIKSETVKMAVNKIMEGEEAEEMRKKVKELGEMAKKAVEKGGSSYSDLNALVDELQKSRN
ncbi:probable UDP-glucosyl transferase 73B6 [Euphorbia lathyris]|uniref:probable UDP-glucosyl transferase 73B6 n=1 Tax=Euphorbia lathyris TaxID=212925 RepID=UPI003313B53F